MDNFGIKNRSFVIIAKRNSGKSHLLKYLLKYSIKNNDFHKIYVVSPTEKINKFYSDLIPANCIYDKYEDEWILCLLDKMSNINLGKTQDCHNPTHCLIVLDDCTSDVNMHQMRGLKMLFTRGRHSFISVCVISQNLKSVSPLMRCNSDFVLTSQLNAASIDSLCDEYRCPLISKRDFIQLYRKSTSDYNFFVINNNSVSENVDDINSYYGMIKAIL